MHDRGARRRDTQGRKIIPCETGRRVLRSLQRMAESAVMARNSTGTVFRNRPGIPRVGTTTLKRASPTLSTFLRRGRFDSPGKIVLIFFRPAILSLFHDSLACVAIECRTGGSTGPSADGTFGKTDGLSVDDLT